MSLSSGTRLGSYEIVAALGAGGMGEVYQARDVRLERSVAIKGLPPEFAADPARRARFEREAKLLASLNHPNIAAIYGVEEMDGCPYLVLEFVEGETLGVRLARAPLTVRETLDAGAQIASAIEAAHERGIIHRDLKPANVMLTPAGMVKVLDFGLARDDGTSSRSTPDLSQSPTIALSATADGLILGTAPYMSPEQARGRAADRRTDVWSFGCVLFECLTGRQVFEGETVSDVLARILEREPDWSALPAAVPARLAELIGRCLTRNLDDRPRDVGDLRRELNAIAQQLSSPSGPGVSRPAPAEAPSLAVLYFENQTRDKDSEYFCSGITEDILTDLSKIKGLRVASRNAVSRYRDTPTDIARIGSELGVRSVLEGSVRRSGDRVRITAQLVNARDGFQLWAERFDRRLDDVFDVQEEIASSIAAALRVALSPGEAGHLVHDRPASATAYDLYLKGREQYRQYTRESMAKALDLFHQAIEIDPNYALAWAGVADCHGQMCQWSAAADFSELTRLGLEAADRAIALNPKLAEGYKARALVLRFAGDDEGERAALVRAIEVNPRFVPALGNLGVSEFGAGNVAASESLARRALQIDPHQEMFYGWLAIVFGLTDRGSDARAACDSLLKLSQSPVDVASVYSMRTWLRFREDDIVAAENEIREGQARGADPDGLRGAEAVLAAATGRPADVRRLVGDIENAPWSAAETLFMAALAAARTGDLERAAAFMSRNALKQMSPVVVRLEPGLHPLLDVKPFAPRRWDRALVWPLECAMIDATRHGLFREVRIESGKPAASQITDTGGGRR